MSESPAHPLPGRPGRDRRVGRATAWAVIGTAVILGCAEDPHRGDAGLQIAWRVESSLFAGVPTRLALQVTEMDWTPRNGLRVNVRGSSEADTLVVTDAPGRGAGSYVVEGFTFPSPGSWTLTARATRRDGRWTERSVTVLVSDGD